MDTIPQWASYALQAWGGVGYLLHKIFLSFAENSEQKRKLSIYGWSAYLLGLPAWVLILSFKHNWIATAVETGGAPAMLFGLIAAWKGLDDTPPRYKTIAKWFVRVFLTIGIAYSVLDYGGITEWSQGLEIACMIGFLRGTNLLANKDPRGWPWFMLMNASMGILVMRDNPILAAQQFISFWFDVYGLVRSRRTKK